MVIILGATGLVGSQLQTVFEAAGHNVWAPTRAELRSFFEGSQTVEEESKTDLKVRMRDAKILINTLGVAPGYGERKQREVYLLQEAILSIALELKIPTIISFSALSHAPNTEEIPYLRYKLAIDALLLTTDRKGDTSEIDNGLRRYIIKPSLIFDPKGKSTQFFKLLAKSPILSLPKLALRRGTSQEKNAGITQSYPFEVSPITTEDLIEFVMTLLTENYPSGIYEVGGVNYLISEYLQLFNPKIKIMPVPEILFAKIMGAMKIILPSVAGKYAYQLLKAGSTPKQNDFPRVMGRAANPIVMHEIGESYEKR